MSIEPTFSAREAAQSWGGHTPGLINGYARTSSPIQTTP
jgi:hypothetical protein